MPQTPQPSQLITITGGSSGLGRAIAQQFNKHQVTVLDTVPPGDQGYTYIKHNVCDAPSWTALAAREPPPDVLFLNAGVMSALNGSPAEQYQFAASTADSYRRIAAVNLDGVVYGLQAYVPRMRPGSCIIVTASIAGLYPYTFDPLYAMTKYGVVGLVRSLEQELTRRNIRIHAFCPNRIKTALLPDATKTAEDLSVDAAAKAAVALIDETSSGFAWVLESEGGPLQRFPPPPMSVSKRIFRYLFKR